MWAFISQTSSSLFHPLPCCMRLPRPVFWLCAPLHHTFHAAEGNILRIFQVPGSILEVDWMADMKTESDIWSKVHFVCFHEGPPSQKRYQKQQNYWKNCPKPCTRWIWTGQFVTLDLKDFPPSRLTKKPQYPNCMVLMDHGVLNPSPKQSRLGTKEEASLWFLYCRSPVSWQFVLPSSPSSGIV